MSNSKKHLVETLWVARDLWFYEAFVGTSVCEIKSILSVENILKTLLIVWNFPKTLFDENAFHEYGTFLNTLWHIDTLGLVDEFQKWVLMESNESFWA